MSLLVRAAPFAAAFLLLAQTNPPGPRIAPYRSAVGGGGAFWFALTRAGQWAAVAVVCPDIIPGSEDLAPNARNLPIRIFQGEADPAVSVESTRDWHRRLLNAGAAVEYIEYPGI